MKSILKWKNWAGNQCFAFSRLEKPRCENDVGNIIKRAIADNQPVRVAGAGHSFTPLVETVGTLVDLDNLRGIIAVDRDSLCFDAWAATRVSDLGDELWQHGLSLSNQGDIDTQTIMGAVATGTHGSGVRLQNFSAMLRGAQFFDGRGKTIDVSNASNSGLLPALQTSLGMLGIVTRVCIQATRSYSIEETIKIVPFAEVMEQWDELISEYRHFAATQSRLMFNQ